MRLIDADALIKRLEDLAADSWNKESGASLYLCDFADLVDDFPSAQQWISVTKRLPNREEYIQCNGLFIVSDGDRTYAEYFDIYDKKCFGEPVIHGFRADRAVMAWMPLPEPFKGAEDVGNQK